MPIMTCHPIFYLSIFLICEHLTVIISTCNPFQVSMLMCRKLKFFMQVIFLSLFYNCSFLQDISDKRMNIMISNGYRFKKCWPYFIFKENIISFRRMSVSTRMERNRLLSALPCWQFRLYMPSDVSLSQPCILPRKWWVLWVQTRMDGIWLHPK